MLLASGFNATAGTVWDDPAFGEGEFFAHRFQDSRRLTFRETIEALAGADVIFVGEYHNDWATHHAEYGILAGLTSLGKRDVASSMEMFERDVQGILDDYLAGRIPEAEFLKKSRPWPNYAVGYREIVEHAKAHGQPVICANAPRRLASQLARKGRGALEALSEKERGLVAREVKTPVGPYKTKFLRVMGRGAGGPNPMAERFYLSQCLKDDTMAESIADFLEKPGRGRTVVIHFNGSFHSDGHLGTAGKFEELMPDKKVVVVKIVSGRDLLSADVEAFRGEADILLVCRKRGEDLQDGAYAFQVSRRVRFLPVLPRPFDPAKRHSAVVAFHDEGGTPRDCARVLAAWGRKNDVVLCPEGLLSVWNADGTPGYGWFSSVRGAEEGEVLEAFGRELGGFLERTYGIAPEDVLFLGFGEGARAALACASGFRGGKGIRLASVNAPASSVPGTMAGPAELLLVNPKGRVPRFRPGSLVRVTREDVESCPSPWCDEVGAVVARAFGLAPAEAPPLSRERTLVVSLSGRSPHARRWAYRIQKDLERALEARVVLHVEGGKVSLADVFMALHLKGVENIVHQPLTEVAAPEYPDWAREELEAKLRLLPVLTVRELLCRDSLPPQPRSPRARKFRFIVLASLTDDEDAVRALETHVRDAGLSNVLVVRERDGRRALQQAMTARGSGGMPGMMGLPPVTYVFRPGFAASGPSAYLPTVYRHGDENVHVRAGLGCLNVAKVILKRLSKSE